MIIFSTKDSFKSKKLRRTFWALIMVILTLPGHAQFVNNNGCVGADFGINAWLYSGQTQTSGFIPPAGSVDWFKGPTGRNVIDETSPGNIQAILQTQENPTYERRMNGKLTSLTDVSGTTKKILIDAVFGRDMFGGTGGIDNTSYNTSSKNGEDPAIWDAGPQNVLGKNDLIDVGGHMFRDINTATSKNDLWFTGLINRAEPGGSAYMDFEFFVEEVKYTPGSGFTSGGPQIGHTAFTFDAGGNITKIGDVIFNVSLEGGGTTAGVQTRIWVSLDDRLSITPNTFNWGAEYDGAFNGSPYVYASILPKVEGLVCGYVNAENQNPTAPPWGTRNTKTNTYGTTYSDYSVAEIGINLTALGLDHSSLAGVDPCYFPLNTFIVKTRTSGSFTAALKDFAGPYAWGQPGFNVELPANPLLSCDNQQITLGSFPARDDVTYSWTTVDGHIVGSSTTSSILVDRPGTYNLQVTLPTNCPVEASSVTVGLDPTKPFFNGPPVFSYTVPCNANDGTVTVSASGATKPYTFSLYNGAGGLITQFTGNATQSTHTFTGLVPANYRVDVKGVYACVITTEEFTIPARTPVVYTPVVTNILCFDNNTGKVELGIVTGKEPLSYAWSNGNLSKDLLNVGAGTYTVSITDGDGCVTTQQFTITQPAELTATISKTNDPGNAGNGSATVTASGGITPYSYEWRKTPDAPIIGSNATLNNIGYGAYTVKVTDANGCFKIFNVFIYEKERCDPANFLIDNDGDGLAGCDDSDCVPPTPASITPNEAFPCKGEVVQYSAAPPLSTTYDSYFWTVPSNATINSGQGTNSITIIWNTTAGGQICVQGKVYNCLSAPTCINITVNDVPPTPGTINIK